MQRQELVKPKESFRQHQTAGFSLQTTEKWQDNFEAYNDIGGPKYFNHFPSAWAHAMCTPFQWTKQIASHFGGTRNPLVISWPAKIKRAGVPASAGSSRSPAEAGTPTDNGLREQFIHTIDIVPTLSSSYPWGFREPRLGAIVCFAALKS